MSRRADGEWSNLAPFLPERSRLRMALLGLSSFLGGLAESMVLVLITLTADSLIRSTDGVTVVGVTASRQTAVIVALVLVVVRVTMTLLSSEISARFASQVMARAQRDLLTAYVNSSHTVRSSRPSGDLTAVTLGHGRFTGDLASGFTAVAASVCGLVSFGGTSLVVNPIATVGIALLGGVLLLAMRPIRLKSQQAAQAFSEGSRTLGRDVSQFEGLHREVEVFQVGDKVLDRLLREVGGGARRLRRLRFLGAVVPQLFQAAMLAAAVVSLLLLVNRSGGSDLAAIGAVVLLLVRSMSAAQQLVAANQRVIEFGSYARGLNELIATLASGRREYGSTIPRSLTPVRLDGVTYSYDGSTPALRDLSLELREGELVGVVGPSGAGKTTLVEMLLRLRLPQSGCISFGSVPLDEILPADFARRVAFVPQRPALIDGTVAENVDFFRGIPEARLREALRQAHLADEIDALPDGILTRLGPDDRSLSGGQAQRLTIARALAGDPEVLVLDEPTSALDALSEEAVRQSLAELPEGRVVVVVAHRFSTLRSCGRILVFRDGALEIDATPDEVVERSEFFRSMVGEGA